MDVVDVASKEVIEHYEETVALGLVWSPTDDRILVLAPDGLEVLGPGGARQLVPVPGFERSEADYVSWLPGGACFCCQTGLPGNK